MPHRSDQSSSSLNSTAHASVRGSCQRDIVWGRPVFRAPNLPSPRVIFDPLPFRTLGFHRPVAGR